MSLYNMQEINRMVTKEKAKNKNQESKIKWKPE